MFVYVELGFLFGMHTKPDSITGTCEESRENKEILRLFCNKGDIINK